MMYFVHNLYDLYDLYALSDLSDLSDLCRDLSDACNIQKRAHPPIYMRRITSKVTAIADVLRSPKEYQTRDAQI